MLKPRLRKLALFAHITTSVGWLGAVACFLVLAVVGLSSRDARQMQAADLAMQRIAWCVLVPLSLASTATGFVSSLTTRWGLIRHHWVLVKLVMTIPATLILLVHLKPIGFLASVATGATPAPPDLVDRIRTQMVVVTGAAVLVLLLATLLSVLKPRGRTRFSRRLQRPTDGLREATRTNGP